MFGEISVWAWMGFAIVFGIGGGTGFFISRQIKDKRTLELEEKLTAARNELSGYKGDVNQHFLKTSLLLGKLTNNYREVYEHLATGAQKLCNEKPNTPKLDLPDTKILPSIEVTNDETPAIELAAETMVEVPDVEAPNAEALKEATGETQPEINLTIEASTENTEHRQNGTMDKVTNKGTAAEIVEDAVISTKEASTEETKQEAGRPAPEDIPDHEDNDEDVHLGAESAPSVETELHKTHPAVH